ncbi:MAG: glucose-6-phosphate isomerase [Planctomycetota bacterium]
MFSVDFNNILDSRLGAVHGLKLADFNALITDNEIVCKQVAAERAQGQHAFLNLPYQDEAIIDRIEELALTRARKIDDFVVLGIGGSALGAITLHNALHPPFYNILPVKARGKWPRLQVLDNIDPEETSALFKLVKPKKTIFNVISKSGETTETTASFLIALKFIKNACGKRWPEHLIVTTDAEKGFLRRFANKEGVTTFETPAKVEGRFSVLSSVGLVPAAFTGIDIRKLLKGAELLDQSIKNTLPESNPAFIAALVNYLYDIKKNKNMLVIMPYGWQLKGLADWFRQLYPESLGKRLDLNKNEVNVGPAVLSSLGTTDQHSQIQLYNEGPNNKLIVFIEIANFKSKIAIPNVLPNEENNSFLAKHRLAELMQIEKRATEYALTRNQRPNYTIRLDEVSPETIGGMFYFFELLTAYAGKLYKINPYNQPGVESGKRATFGMLGREGYTGETVDVNNILTKDDKWIIKAIPTRNKITSE